MQKYRLTCEIVHINCGGVCVLCRESGDNLQLILVRDAPLVPPDLPPSSVAAAQASSPLRGTSTLPRSHRFPSPSHHTHSHAPSTRHHAPLSSSFSYGALSQDQLPLMAVRSSHQYSSLSHLPRARLATGPQSYGGCSSILSQPPEFDLDPQVWDMGYGCMKIWGMSV